MPQVPAGFIDPNDEVWRFLLARLEQGKPVVLLLVVASGGATPGRAGFKMAVAAGEVRSFCGSIGGGKVEFELVETARAMLREKHPKARVLRRVHRPEDRETSGMICGGWQTVALLPCRAEDGPAITALLRAKAVGKSGLLDVSAKGLSFRTARAARVERRFGKRGPPWSYTEFIAAPETLFIVGGGHVGLALSRVMATLGFRIVVLDSRTDLDTLAQNTFAHERRIVAFDRVGKVVPPGPRSYAVIMTPGHAADEAALRQLVAKPLRYLGMMASRRKAAEVLARLRADGVAEPWLRRVRTPVGLPIGSQTPAEIAISIAAEIIQVRHQPEPAD